MKYNQNMKTLLTLIITLAGWSSQATGNDNKATLVVKVSNLGDMQGQLMVGIFDSQDNFLEKPIIGKTAKATAEGQEVIFEDVPFGVYAVSVIHDENENSELDTFIVVPTEPYGFSNNVMDNMGPPSFEQAQFSFQKNTTIEIKLNR